MRKNPAVIFFFGFMLIGVLVVVLVVVDKYLPTTKVNGDHLSSLTESLKKITTESLPGHFTVVYYQRNIPGLQTIIIKRGGSDYFVCLASNSDNFEKGEEVEVYAVTRVSNSVVHESQFLVVYKKHP